MEPLVVQQITALHLLPKLSALQHHLTCANIIYNHQFTIVVVTIYQGGYVLRVQALLVSFLASKGGVHMTVLYIQYFLQLENV